MIGNTERGPEAIAAIREFQSVYLIAVGGAAYLISKAIHSARVLAFADLGMEAIYEFDVVDMPVTVAVAAVGQILVNSTNQAILFTPAGLGQLKHAFVAGAVLSLIGLFTRSPLTPPKA